jgi:aspartyl-tRNA(Asn)/glutamyl-tRNA(Gln) amidotransferase subunit C
MRNRSPSTNVPLNLDDIQKLAELARLEIEVADIPELAEKLTGIVALVNQLNEANTDGIEPMAHPLEHSQRLRPDKVTETDQHELFQANAPLVERDLYLVPKVIE